MISRIKTYGLALLLVLLILVGGDGSVQAATFTVNSTNDAFDEVCDETHCSLREAIDAANALPGTDTIAFDIDGSGPHTIQPSSPLPTITDPVIIDGFTQPGASANTNPITQGSNAVMKI